MNQRTQSRTAAGLLITWLTIMVALTAVQSPTYSPVSQAMSELALGRGGGLMNLAFVCLGSGMILVGVLIRRTIPRARVLPAMLGLGGILGILSGVFNTNGDGPPTLVSRIHVTVGISLFVLMIFTMATAAVTFQRSPHWRPFALPTAIWALAGLGTFFLVPLLGDPRFGLAQRAFVATWLSWLIAVAWKAADVNQLAGNHTSGPETSMTEPAAHGRAPKA
jgi:hypothetical membrane protein